ncbi:hypothetical protein, partial [Sphingobacterium sp.]|uniref:hypothetical protein n=1 Tax=Sphingobacterium sp. TaxID=341027 RepID=UPI00289697B2
FSIVPLWAMTEGKFLENIKLNISYFPPNIGLLLGRLTYTYTWKKKWRFTQTTLVGLKIKPVRLCIGPLNQQDSKLVLELK